MWGGRRQEDARELLEDLGTQLRDVTFSAARAVSRLIEMQTPAYQARARPAPGPRPARARPDLQPARTRPAPGPLPAHARPRRPASGPRPARVRPDLQPARTRPARPAPGRRRGPTRRFGQLRVAKQR